MSKFYVSALLGFFVKEKKTFPFPLRYFNLKTTAVNKLSVQYGTRIHEHNIEKIFLHLNTEIKIMVKKIAKTPTQNQHVNVEFQLLQSTKMKIIKNKNVD